MAERTLAENVAQVKSDFKGIRDGFANYFDSIYEEPTSAYGSYPKYTYDRGKEDGISEGIEQGKQEVNDSLAPVVAGDSFEVFDTDIENVAQVKADFKAIEVVMLNRGAIIPIPTPTSDYAKILNNTISRKLEYANEVGIELGKQLQYDEFWDNLQQNGTRTNYANAFYFWGNCLSPKYDIKPTGTCNSMFFYLKFEGDLKKRFEDCGVVLDTSKATNLNFLCQAAYYVTAHPPIDVSNCGSNTQSLFYANRALVTAELRGINESTVFASCFLECFELQNMTFSGKIAKDLSIKYSTKLSRASILSLLNCLTVAVSGITITLPSMCIDGATDTIALIQSDTELNTAYTQALENGYTITFV